MGISDPVVWGSIVAVGTCMVIFVFLLSRIKALMAKDAAAHKK